MKTPVHLKTLPGGLRVITEEAREVDTVALGVWACVGTRNELPGRNGAAHMVEHMLFKGTTSRSSLDIAEQIENVGGHMNAYTSRELTSYHIHLLKEDFRLGLDVLADMVLRSTLPDEEIERERQVILQEIGMVYDTPDDYVFDLYQQAAYPAQSLGLPVLGDPKSVSGMGRSALREYIGENYRTGNLIISVAGNVDHEEVETAAAELFAGLPEGSRTPPAQAVYGGGETRLERELEQAHIVLGFKGVSRTSADYQAAVLLSTLLGGGMSSRLFQEVRERRGLAYSIFSTLSAYTDCGQVEIYAGTGPNDLAELIPVLCDEIAKVVHSVKEEEVSRAKAQRRSMLLMARESMMRRADRNARYLAYCNGIFDTDRELAEMEKIDASRISQVAGGIFASPPTLAALGPLSGLGEFHSISERLAA